MSKNFARLLIYDRRDVFVKPPGESSHKHRLELVDEGGHFGALEARNKVIDVVGRFIQKDSPP
jgi:hypothetical protein